MSTTQHIESNSGVTNRRAVSKPTVAGVCAVAVLALAFLSPIAGGYRYHALPLALWSIGSKKLVAGTVRIAGQSQTVYAGREIDCGFFSLVKQTPVDWAKLDARSRIPTAPAAKGT